MFTIMFILVLKFWDEVDQFPAIHLNAGSETRQYQSGGYKDRYLNITTLLCERDRCSLTL